MTIQIGAATLATRNPSNLDASLLADLGCNAVEVALMMAGDPLAGTIARALLPFLPEDGRPEVGELATQIDAAGTREVAAQVAALYVPAPEAPAARTPAKAPDAAQ